MKIIKFLNSITKLKLKWIDNIEKSNNKFLKNLINLHLKALNDKNAKMLIKFGYAQLEDIKVEEDLLMDI